MKYKLLIPWILFALSLGANAYLILHSNLINNSSNLTQQEITDTVNTVGKLIVLPTNETPTIAVVTDLSVLKNQPFFANAKVGDKVLIYTKAQKAILYDPQLNKIVELAPLGTTSSQETAIAPAAATSASSKAK